MYCHRGHRRDRLSTLGGWLFCRGRGSLDSLSRPGCWRRSRRSVFARHVEPNRERRLGDRHTRSELELTIVWDDHIFITSSISAGEEETPHPRGFTTRATTNGSRRSLAEHRWMVYAIDFDSGEVVWERELHGAPPPIEKHLKNSFASETPVTDGERIYVYFGSIGLVSALTMGGEVVWTKEIGAFNTTQGFGMAASPALHNDRLYIVNDNTTESFMVVFDKATGEEIWRVPRAEGGRNWSTPFIWENDRRAEIVTAGTGGVRAYDLEGDLLWELKGMSGLTIPSPFAKHGLLYISSGYPGGGIRPVYAIRPGASGDISLWPDIENFAARFPGPEKHVRRYRLVLPATRYLQYFRARLRRLLLHPTRSRFFSLPRREDRRGDIWPEAPRDWKRIHRVTLGV